MPGGYGRGNRYRWWYRETGLPGWMRERGLPKFYTYPYGDEEYKAPYTAHESIPIYPRANRPLFPAQPPVPEVSPEEELRMLEEEKRAIEWELEQIRKRISEIKETEGDPRLMEIYNLLPKVNCSRCGYPTCLDCARGILKGEAPPDACRIVGKRIEENVKSILSKK